MSVRFERGGPSGTADQGRLDDAVHGGRSVSVAAEQTPRGDRPSGSARYRAESIGLPRTCVGGARR